MHTPLTLSTTCDHRPAIADARGINIASWDPATIELFDDVRPDIVQAVNSYEAMRALANHIIAMADDAYLTGHPEWLEIVEEALALAEGKEPS